MKQEKIAMSMSYIDDDLIIEAAKVRKPATRTAGWSKLAIRFGGLAACLVLVLGLTFGTLTGGVTMDGRTLTELPVPLTASETVQQPFSPASEAPRSIVLEFNLDFSKPTSLTFEQGSIAIVCEDGSLEPIDQTQKLRGSLTLQLIPETVADTYTITTNRGYDIVLTLADGAWYIHIEK